MKFLKPKLETIASKDITRQTLVNPWLDLSDPKKPMLVATDGHRLMALPADEWVEEHDTHGPVPIDAIKAARKLKTRIDLTSATTAIVNGVAYPRVPTDRLLTSTIEAFHACLPSWRRILPVVDRPEMRIQINANYLADVAGVLGAANVAIHADAVDVLAPLRVTVTGEDGNSPDAIAVVMPWNLNETTHLRDCKIVIDGATEATDATTATDAAPAVAAPSASVDDLDLQHKLERAQAVEIAGIAECEKLRAALKTAQAQLDGAKAILDNTTRDAQALREEIKELRNTDLTALDLKHAQAEIEKLEADLKTEREEHAATKKEKEESDEKAEDTDDLKQQHAAERSELLEQIDAALDRTEVDREIKRYLARGARGWCPVCEGLHHAADCMVLKLPAIVISRRVTA